MYSTERAQMIDRAALRAEEAERRFQELDQVRPKDDPERLMAMREAESAHGAYAELRYGTQ